MESNSTGHSTDVGAALSSHSAALAIGGLLACLLLHELWFRSTHAYKTLKNMPGPYMWPVIGNGHLGIGLTHTEIMEKALQIWRQCGPVVRGNLCGKFLVFLTHPSDIEVILNSQVHLEKSDEYRFFKPWFGDGLLISKGAHWRHHRKVIAPTFHQSILKSFVPTFVKNAKRVVERLQAVVHEELDVHKYMSQVTVEILLSTAMGMKQLPDNAKSVTYAQAVVDMCDIIHKRQVNFLYRFDFIYNLSFLADKGNSLMKIILALAKSVISERQQNLNVETDSVVDSRNDVEKLSAKCLDGLRDDLDDIDEDDIGAKHRLAFLDAMVDRSNNAEMEWTEKDISDEVNTIMFEGHDTTSAGSSFVLCLLGLHGDVQRKVYEEQRSIFGTDMGRDVTFADTLQMHYLERVIKETLRLYPPVPIIARKVKEDVKLASGPYTIPRDTTVVVCPFGTHRSPDIYDNPNKFDPDNFLPDNVSKRHYYSYIPFSAGPRSCVGRKYAMLMFKVLLSTLLRKYKVWSRMGEENFKLQADIILKMENGFNIFLEERI